MSQSTQAQPTEHDDFGAELERARALSAEDVTMFLRDQFAAAALSGLIAKAVVTVQSKSTVVGANGQQQASPPTTMLSPQGLAWACEAAFDAAEVMLLARAGQLPNQRATLKAAADAADLAASPAAPLLKGPGAA